MIFKITFCLYWICYYKAFALYINSPLVVPESEEILTDKIGNWLEKPLKYLQHIDLKIRSNHYQQDFENTYTQWFLKQILVPITISKYELMEENKNTIHNVKCNYVIVSSMAELRLTAGQFGTKGGVLFFILSDEIDIKELRNIFHFAWKELFIYKSVILTENGPLIYDPFAEDEFGNYGKIIDYTGEETIERTIFYNMRGYPLRVQVFKSVYSKLELDPITKKVKRLYGVDGRVANLLQEYLNFTMNLQDPDPNYFGERTSNGTYSGAIGAVIRNELDLCLVGFFLKDYMVPEMEFSVAIYDDKLCIYTPKAKKIPESILPLFAVRHDIWFSFIFMAFVCSLLWAILRFLNLRFNIIQLQGNNLAEDLKWQYARILIDTWVVWVRVNLVHYPPFHSERIFMASLCLISVIFGAVFESSLATVYINPIYYNDINTLKELDDSGLRIEYKYSAMADDLFFNETSPLFADLNKKLLFINNIEADVVVEVAQKGGKAGVTRLTTLKMQSLHLIVSKQLWIVPECPKYYALSYVWPKYSPWADSINHVLLHLQSAGIFNKYIAEMNAQVDIKIMKDHLYEVHNSFIVLTIEDLQLAFYALLIGFLLAILSILAERKLMSKTY